MRSFLSFTVRAIRAAGRRVGNGDPEDLHQLVELHAYVDQAVQCAVDGLRDNGATWQDIGTVFHTTRQAAQMRWGRPKREG